MKYFLSERAAAFLRKLMRDANAVVAADTAAARKIRPDAAAVASSGPRYHWHMTLTTSENTTTAKVDGGAVQIGGFTYFGDGVDDLSISCNGYVCVKTNLASGSCEVVFVVEDELSDAQSDMDYYIFPIYKIVDGAKANDYRPMPNAGCWES